MKLVIATAAALAVAALGTSALAEGAKAPAVTGYVNLGYTHIDPGVGNLHALGGRLGARFGKYIGVEGEGAFGVGSDSVTISGVKVNYKEQSQFAGYAVGFIPLSPQFDVFARVGYGRATFKAYSGSTSASSGENSVNYGGGGQYFFTMHDGIRAEYTRYSFRNGGGDANTFSVSYVRKFP